MYKKEATELTKLLMAINNAVDYNALAIEAGREDRAIDNFAITVDGTTTYFAVGGPQVEALFEFIKSLADANGYKVNLANNTVEE